jgi:hypothetical protein
MPGADWTTAARGLIRLAAVTVLFAQGASRAEVPLNPLRPEAPPANTPQQASASQEEPDQADIWKLPADEPTRPIWAGEELPPPEPKSVVPDHLGQPKGPHGESWPEPAGDSWVQPWFTHTDPNDPYRHVGLGRPLIGTSWLNRPWYVGAFIGGLLADDLISNRVESNNSFFIGGRLGWDFDHYWGLEGRYAFSRPQLSDGTGDPLSDAAREYFVDVSLAYYPWGDSQWRPYASIGLGFQTFRFHDDTGERIHQSLLSMPLGLGLKFFHSPHCTLRLEACDNIAFGDGNLKTMQNFTLAAGVEFRFGGRPTSYFPWHGSTSYW